MLFKPNTLIFIQRGGLLVAGKHLTSLRMQFPDDVVHNLEVENPNKLVDICRQFFVDKALRAKRILIVLDYSVVFEKTIELDKTGKPDLLLSGFLEAMPYDPGKRACIAMQTGSNLRLFGTNAELYEAVNEACKAAGVGTILAVVPIAAYNLGDSERTIRAATERILKSNDLGKQANFKESSVS